MFSTSRLWRITGLAAFVATLLLLWGFLVAVRDVVYPTSSAQSPGKTEEEVQPVRSEKTTMDVTAIGDSLAKGTGDDTGSGFAKRTVEILQKQGVQSSLVNNLGINGLTTKGLLPMLEEEGVKYSLREADIMLLSIGANDLFDGSGDLETMTELPSEAELDVRIKNASQNFAKIVKRLHEINSEAELVYIGLYNPFSDMKQLKITGDLAVSKWNALAADTIAENGGGLVVPASDLFTLQAAGYLSGDHFHPNGSGYQAIAERIVQGLVVKK